ncbi:transporter substrate-binding protein, partial [Verrucomicrobiales bacterium]|nr:transporter substrate-binding protein [Verrucomicrobiales bacterium]
MTIFKLCSNYKKAGRSLGAFACLAIAAGLTSCGGESSTTTTTAKSEGSLSTSGELETFVSASVSTIKSPAVITDVTYKEYSAADYPTAEVNTTGLAVTDTTVTVGQLHSITGTMAISETGSVEAERLAIKQINDLGGVLGRKIEIVQEDGASDWPTFAEKAKKLIINDKVACVFGCWTSASRKAVLPVFEKENNMLYYPTFYEGLEDSKNVIYTGQEATQQIIWGLDWAYEKLGTRTFYLIGSDYIWPRTSNKIARNHIERYLKKKDPKCKVVGEEYYPLGHTNFRSLINKVKLKKPDLIYSVVVGGSNVAWYKQLKA